MLYTDKKKCIGTNVCKEVDDEKLDKVNKVKTLLHQITRGWCWWYYGDNDGYRFFSNSLLQNTRSNKKCTPPSWCTKLSS